MTAADHANRIREALKHTIVEVEGYTGRDVWWKPQVEAALTALDALQAQAEEIQREYILCGRTVDRLAEENARMRDTLEKCLLWAPLFYPQLRAALSAREEGADTR